MGKTTQTPAASTYRRIIYAYDDLGSVKAVAEKCHASEVTVRRVLITEGLWSSRSSRQVEALREQGLSVQEIAAAMSVSVKAVEAYMPYSRGMYGESATEDAQHSREYRERVSDAQNKMRTLTGENGDGKIRIEDEPIEVCPQESSDVPEQDVEPVPILRLHLELVRDFVYGEEEEDLDLSEEERKRFFSLAKAERGISRDILVPADMNLHALHYAIQRLFGWQNSHLHCFSLTPGDFEHVTNGNFGEYSELCGILFRFPNDDYADQYWDDDYEEQISVKSWLRKKYRAPFRCECVSDSWLGNQWDVEDFLERFPQFTRDESIEDVLEEIIFDGDLNSLSERLCIGELMVPSENSIGLVNDWKAMISYRTRNLQEEMIEFGVDPKRRKDAAEELREWRASLNELDRIKWLNPTSYRSEVRKQTGRSYEETLAYHREEVAFWEERCCELVFDWNINLEPIFHELYYFYDYGDDWCVRITAVEEMSAPPADVEWDGNAVCVAADGLNLVDDCGGIHGYMDMLETLHGSDRKEAQEMRDWARGLGWTGRKSRPEKML